MEEALGGYATTEGDGVFHNKSGFLTPASTAGYVTSNDFVLSFGKSLYFGFGGASINFNVSEFWRLLSEVEPELESCIE